jgi:predicted acyl esterase
MYPTSVLLRKGHRIRVALAGADASLFEGWPAEGTPKLTISRGAAGVLSGSACEGP